MRECCVHRSPCNLPRRVPWPSRWVSGSCFYCSNSSSWQSACADCSGRWGYYTAQRSRGFLLGTLLREEQTLSESDSMTIPEDCVISEKWSWFESLALWHTACSHQVSQLWDALALLVLGLLSLNVIGIRAKSLVVLWAKGFQIKWHFELKIGNQNGNFFIYEENLMKVKYFHWFWRPRTCKLSSLGLSLSNRKNWEWRCLLTTGMLCDWRKQCLCNDLLM